MIPELGQRVKCLLRNGALAEGIVLEWADNSVQLKSLEDESIVIIHHPEEDIMLTKIIIEAAPKSFAEAMKRREQQKVLGEIQQREDKEFVEFMETNTTNNPFNDDYNKGLAQLYKESTEQERTIIANKLRDHYIKNDGKKVKYDYPGFFKKPSPK